MFRFPLSWTRVTSISILLVPFSWMFRAVAALRRALYRAGILRSEKLPVPVIVVGNIIVGGSGKTPLVLWLAARLREAGHTPGIISRGYGAKNTKGGTKTEGVRQVVATDDPASAGDEPVLLARRAGCPVWVGRNRVAAARALLAAHPSCNVIISDDGLQHYALARDIEIAVIDGARMFGNGLLLPAGPLREPLSRLAKVDAVVVNGESDEQSLSAGPRFEMNLRMQEIYNLLNSNNTIDPARLAALRVHAVAGIGNPQRFFTALEELGITFTAHAYPDHHAYSESDLQFANCDAVVMTEKDAVKCERYATEKHWVLRVNAHVDAALAALVARKLAGKR